MSRHTLKAYLINILQLYLSDIIIDSIKTLLTTVMKMILNLKDNVDYYYYSNGK